MVVGLAWMAYPGAWAKSTLTVQQRITRTVLAYQPKKGESYAKTVAYEICKASAEHRIDPLIPTSVAIIESGFTMVSKPQLGMFQFTRSTWRSLYGVRGWKALSLTDNIRAGVDYLARHYWGTTKRNDRGTYYSLSARSAYSLPVDYGFLRRALGRYNGCGVHGAYVRKVLNVYKNLKRSTVPKARGSR